jgi:hypothetical protein
MMSSRLLSLIVLMLLLGVGAMAAPLVRADGGVATAVTPVTFAQTETSQSQDDPPADEPPLPDSLGRIFAALSVFIVTMFTLAIGTEIVVDVFKLILGIQSKPSARKTLEEYQRLLPGTLASLGVSREAQQRLEHQLADVKRLLEPAFRVEDAVVNIRTDSLKKTLDELFTSSATEAQMAQVTQTVKGRLRRTLTDVAQRLSLGETAVRPLLQQLDQLIDSAVAHANQWTPDDLLQQANRLINDDLADPIANWAQTKLADLHGKTYAQARLEYEKLIPVIENSGLSPDAIRHLRVQFESYLEQLQKAELGHTYLDALNELLGDLERQRNIVRSRLQRFGEWLQRHLLPGRYNAKVANRTVAEMQPRILTLEHAPGQLLALDQRDAQDRSNYVLRVRALSVVIGVVLAYMLQLDAADMLTGFLPDSAAFLSTEYYLIPGWLPISAGIILTGLGASAGSGFWHDQLSRLQAVKKQAETAYTAVQPVIVNQRLDAD